METAVRRWEDAGSLRQITAREREVLHLFGAGFGTADVAARLEISPVTVRNHAQSILSKLGVHSRLEAVARGYALGLISLPAREQHISGR